MLMSNNKSWKINRNICKIDRQWMMTWIECIDKLYTNKVVLRSIKYHVLKGFLESPERLTGDSCFWKFC
jgi:hypothetical protein